MRRFSARVKKAFHNKRANKTARSKAKLRAKQSRRFARTHR